MGTSTFPTVTTGVTVQTSGGGLTGDGSSGNKLAFDFSVLAAPPANTALGAVATPYSVAYAQTAFIGNDSTNFTDTLNYGTIQTGQVFTSPFAAYQAGLGLVQTSTTAGADSTIQANLEGLFFFPTYNVTAGTNGASVFLNAGFDNYRALVISNNAWVGVFDGSIDLPRISGGGTVDQSRAEYRLMNLTDTHLNFGAGMWDAAPLLHGTAAIDTWVYHYALDLGVVATNAYYSWFDSRGVRRVKEDATFDSVGQAIEALYNPQFTKYTPGATNFERIVLGQWNGNVAEVGTEKGGTGTLRDLRLIGTNIQLNANTIVANGKAIQTDTTTAHTALIQAYDVDGTAYKTFGTLTNGNTPSFVIAAPSGGALTVGGMVLTTAVVPATTGTRYLIIDASGNVTSSASAPSGT